MLLGTRLWYPFYPAAVQTDDDFTKQMDQIVREIGARGKRGGKLPATTHVPPPGPVLAPAAPPPSGEQGTAKRPSAAGVDFSPSLAEMTALLSEIRQAVR
eukprot:SAG31_NODE_7582_length_1648_cov_1.127179_2_plen_100_part_00